MTIHPDKICFGLDEVLDRSSFDAFLRLAGNKKLTETLAKRMSREEMYDFVNTFTELLKKHLSENEYHRLFLGSENNHSTQSNDTTR